MEKMQGITRHHIVPQSRDGALHDPRNIVNMQDHYHVNLHRFFGNMRPDEQILRIVQISETALLPAVRWEIKAILADPEYVYQKGILIQR